METRATTIKVPRNGHPSHRKKVVTMKTRTQTKMQARTRRQFLVEPPRRLPHFLHLMQMRSHRHLHFRRGLPLVFPVRTAKQIFPIKTVVVAVGLLLSLAKRSIKAMMTRRILHRPLHHPSRRLLFLLEVG